MANATWLAEALRSAGLQVVERPGWKSRGRGELGKVRGVVVHHTASNPRGGNAPALSLVENGRGPPKPLPGPLSQLLLSRDGTFYVIAAGRTNHAGRGYWQGVSDGNGQLIGIEAENDGIGEPWPAAQLEALEAGVAAILEHIGADAVMAVGHKEWALPKGRKIDPSFPMFPFREEVERAMGGEAPLPIPGIPEPPARAMLQKGDRGQSVRELQSLLGLEEDGDFGPKTDAAVRSFQKANGLAVDGKVGPKTWAALDRE